MDKFGFLSRFWKAKRVSRREVGPPRRRQDATWREWFQWLEGRQLLTGMVTQTASYSYSVPTQVTDYSQPIPLPPFNPALGTLQSVTLSLAGSGNISGTAFNNGPSETSDSVSVSSVLDLVDDVARDLVAGTLNLSQSFPNVPAGGSIPFGPVSATTTPATVSETFTDPTTLAEFTLTPGGSNIIPVDLATTTTQTTTGGNGNSPIDVITKAGGNVTVLYTYSVPTVSISGSVYQDALGTGQLQAGDPPIPGTTLSLVNSSDQVIATTTTGPTGAYSFTQDSSGNLLLAGSYEVIETQPAGYLQGTNTVGTVNGVTVGDQPVHDVIADITLAAGQSSINNNFGEVLPVAITGTVYVDVPKAGMLVPGDPPIGDVTIGLYDASGLVATTTTNAAGNYAFSTTSTGAPLPPDTYTLEEIQPAGYLQGTNTVGTVNGTSVGFQPAQDTIAGIALHSGQASINNDFGELTPPAPPPPPPPPVPPPPPPPPPVNFNVTTVDRFGVHLQPTLVVIAFDQPLDPAVAQNVGSYQIYGPTDSKTPAPVPIQSATYNAATGMVTLRLDGRLQVHHPYQLTINGLTDASGGVLVGNTGPGTAYVTTLSRSNLAGFTDIYGNFIPINHGQLYPAAIASGYHLKKYVAPKGLGSFAQANTATFLAATAGDPEPAPITLRRGKHPVKAVTGGKSKP